MKIFKPKTYLQGFITSIVAMLIVVGVVSAATTISNAIIVGTDLTVTSGAQIGTGSTGDHITALADDSILVEGQSEFDGTAWFDGSLRASSTLLVTGATTASSTSITVNTSDAVALTVTQSGSSDILNVVDGSTEVLTILDGGNLGISSSTPSAKLSVGDTTAGATSTIDLGIPCFRMNTYKDGALTEVYYYPCLGDECNALQSATGWATSTTSCF